MINNENPVSCLTVDQLSAIWGPDSKIANWSEIPRPRRRNSTQELRASTARAPTPARSTTSPKRSTVRRARRRKDYNNVGENDNATVSGVEGSPGGMGYFGFSYYTENEGKLKALEVDDGKGCVGPSVETAQDGSYTPLSRPLFIYPSDAGAEEARGEGVRQVLPRQRRPASPNRVGFVPLTEEQLEESEACREAGRHERVGSSARDRRPVGAGGRSSGSRPPPRYGEKAIQGLLAACALISVLTTTAIVVSLLGPTIGFFEVVPSSDFLSDTDWTPQFDPPSFGVCAIVAGTLNVTLWAMLVRDPDRPRLGDLPQRVRARRGCARSIKPVLEMLAGIPTVAIGFFAVSFLLPEIIVPLWPGDFLGGAIGKPFMALAAALGIGLMIVPIIASISEDAMTAVPRGLREGAYALGATKAQGRDPGRLPGGALGHRRLDRAGDLARGRGDDDRR